MLLKVHPGRVLSGLGSGASWSIDLLAISSVGSCGQGGLPIRATRGAESDP